MDRLEITVLLKRRVQGVFALGKVATETLSCMEMDKHQSSF